MNDATPDSPLPSPTTDTAGYRVGDLLIDLLRERVTRGAIEIKLPKLSFDLFAALVRSAPALVSVDALMSAVWPGLVVGPETVVQRVKLLRVALGDDSKQPRYVEGVRGRGYRLVAPVRRLADAETALIPAPGGSSPPPERARARPRSLGPIAAVAGMLATLTLAGVSWFLFRPASPPLPPQQVRLAVLPLENLSSDPADRFFADGIHQELISALTERAPSLGVIARTTMLGYRGRPGLRASAVGRDLGATHVLEGTVSRDGEHLRLTATLIDAGTETSVWSKSYDRSSAEAPGLLSDVALDVASRLAVQTRGAPRQITSNPDAYDLYLKALVSRQAAAPPYASAEALEAVAQLLSKAIELDPEFGAAYAERAGVHFETLLNNLDTSAEEIQRIRSDLDAAVRLAPEHPNTLAARAWYAALIDGDFRSAAELFTAAERAGLSDSFWMSAIPGVLGTLGRYDDSLLACQHAVTLDPANSTAITRYAFALMLFHRPLEAVHVVDFGAANSPGDLRLTWLRPMVRFSFTGNRDSLAPVLERPALDPRSRTAGFPLPVAFVFLRWSGRVDEFDALLKDVPTETVRAQFAAVGQEPVARYRGWTALLRGDRAAAGNEGRRVLAFLASAEETEFNRAFRRLLAAEAYTFLGESARAVATMREAPDIRFDFGLDFQKSKAAVYAWAGAEDDALGLLERLATRTPGVGPAEVARDPLYTIPLAGNPRFASLVARLEAEMRELQVE